MTRFRFRAWHAEQGEMRHFEFEEYLGGYGLMNPYIGGEKAVWMQSTALTDKNGQEIFEGDIVRLRFPIFDGKDHRKVIDYCYENGEVLWQSEFASYWLELSQTGEQLCGEAPEDYEVVGNIYENPELLP